MLLARVMLFQLAERLWVLFWRNRAVQLGWVLTYLALAAPLLTAQALPLVEVKGLFKGQAVLQINGKQRLIKQGKQSPEGVTLVEATSEYALIEVNGEQRQLTLSTKIGGHYQKPSKAEVRLPSARNGHYFAHGTINGRSVRFLVDTGASAIAMGESEAKALGVRFEHGEKLQVNTASGVVMAFFITLNNVSIGGLSLNNVAAAVIEGSTQKEILLGNSFLGRVDLRVEKGVMILQSKY